MNDVVLYQSFTALPVKDSHLYHLCDICTTFEILFARFIHLAHLAAKLVQCKAHATASDHTHAVSTATTTVITISPTISHIIFAFSSLRFQNQYHFISL